MNNMLTLRMLTDCRHAHGQVPTICKPMVQQPQPSSPDASEHTSGVSGCVDQNFDIILVSRSSEWNHHCSCERNSPRIVVWSSPRAFIFEMRRYNKLRRGFPASKTCAIQVSIPANDSSVVSDTDVVFNTSRTRDNAYFRYSLLTRMVQSVESISQPKKGMFCKHWTRRTMCS